MGGAGDTPASKVLRRFRLIGYMVLRAVELLGGKADLQEIAAVVSDMEGERVGS